jgi:putative membrane protein
METQAKSPMLRQRPRFHRAYRGRFVIVSNLFTLPAFIAYLVVGIVYFVAFIIVYIWITPQREISLIQEGNMAAAISLGGAAIGFVLPLASAIAHAVSLMDVALWGLVALVVQLLAHVVLRLVFHDLRGRIEANIPSVALFAAIIAICIGIINAAAMTY